MAEKTVGKMEILKAERKVASMVLRMAEWRADLSVEMKVER